MGDVAQAREREPGGGQRRAGQHQHQDQLQHPPNGICKPVDGGGISVKGRADPRAEDGSETGKKQTSESKQPPRNRRATIINR